MSQNDYVITNQSAPDFRSDLNDALQALASLSSGGTAPSSTYANMMWYDTSTNILKMRSEADDAWISIGYIDQSSNAFRILDDTQVTNTSGTQTGLLGDQTTATWETGTGATESLVSPAKVKAAINELAPKSGWTYESAATTLSANTTANFSHGLGQEPNEIDFDLVCTTANSGYVVGDKIKSSMVSIDALSGRGMTMYVGNGNTTQVTVATGSSLRSRSANGGSEVPINFTDWDIIVKAR